MSRFFRVAVDKIAVEWLLLDRFLEAAMIASESTEFTLDRTARFSCNALQEALDSPVQTMPDGGATFLLSSSESSVPMLPIDRTTSFSIRRIQKKQPTATHHHATHN